MADTIISKFQLSANQHGQRTALAYLDGGQYQTISYQELDNHRLYIAGWWQELGFRAGDKVAIMLPNSPEWIISDLAAATLGLVAVPIHTTFSGDYLANVVKHAEASLLIIDQASLDNYQGQVKSLSVKQVIVVGKSEQYLVWPEKYGPADRLEILSPVSAKDVHTIVYTSGTTGDPKGVMLTQENLVANAEAALRRIPLLPADRFFSFLPLSHAFERMAGYYAPIFSGCSIYFAQSTKTMVADIRLARPTILPSVPRIFERIYDKIFDNIRSSSSLKQKLFYQAIDLARASRHGKLPWWQGVYYRLLDKIVLKKLRDILGGRLRLAISGGSSLNPAIGKFFENLGIQNIEGYGLTETSPIVAVNKIDFHKYGTVGPALDCNKIKISDDKEVLVKGKNVMPGYYKNEALTGEAFDQDGWFKTGDLGFIDADGFLTIIGRAKDMIVLSTGKKVFPEPIENALNATKYIRQSMVYGNQQKHISALIVPDFEELKIWSKERGATFDLDSLGENKQLQELFRQEMDKALERFSHIEKVAEFKLLAEEFTQENGLLTLTLKLRRHHILRRYLS
ncbi:MAG: long-chain fatty acid--CoA ligase [Patescibacteria group bacterium]